MPGHVGMLRKGYLRMGRVQQAIGIRAVDDVCPVASIPERMRETIGIHRIAPKTVGGVKRRQVQKEKRSIGHAGENKSQQDPGTKGQVDFGRAASFLFRIAAAE